MLWRSIGADPGRYADLRQRSRSRVAGFLGVSNLLDAEVVGRNDRYAELRTPDGVILRAPSSALNGATTLRLGVRPEKLRVTAVGDEFASDAGPETNAIEGTVLDASYIGVSTQYLVKTTDGHTMTVYAQNLETGGASEVLADGQRVRLTWKPQHTFVIGPATGPAPSQDPKLEDTETDA